MPDLHMYNTLRSRKRPREEDYEAAESSAANTSSSRRQMSRCDHHGSTAVVVPKTPRQEPRNVSFCRRPMPGAKPRAPGHRTSASPSRSALRGASSAGPPHDNEDCTPKPERTHPSLAPWRTPELSPAKRVTIKNYHGRSCYHDLLQHARSPLIQPLKGADDNALDDMVCQRVHVLMQRVIHFATHFRPVDEKHRDAPLHLALLSSPSNAQSVRYIGYLALATPNGLAGWDRMLGSTQSLQTLVVALIGQVLKRYVFGASWFGGADDPLDDCNSHDMDVFYRSTQRATRCQDLNNQTGTAAAKAVSQLEQAEERLAAKIVHLVLPLYNLGRSNNRRAHLAVLFYPRILELVVYASTLSRQLRMVPDVVYEWTTAFKGTKFEAKHMEAVNIGPMLQSSPYVPDGNGGHAKLRDGAAVEQSQPSVLINVFPGLVAYRRTARRVAAHSRGDRQLQGESVEFELVARILAKRSVFLYWGSQKKVAALTGTSAWGDAVKAERMESFVREDQEGVVELFDAFIEVHGAAAWHDE